MGNDNLYSFYLFSDFCIGFLKAKNVNFSIAYGKPEFGLAIDWYGKSAIEFAIDWNCTVK